MKPSMNLPSPAWHAPRLAPLVAAFLAACSQDSEGTAAASTTTASTTVTSGDTSSNTSPSSGGAQTTLTSASNSTGTTGPANGGNSGAGTLTGSSSGGSSVGGVTSTGMGATTVGGGATGSGTSAGGAAASTTGSDEPRPTVTAEPGTDLVKVDPGIEYQSFEGWGTSLCWWANHVGGWSQAARDRVVDAVVDPDEGLGYNIFRYNIGGGENPAHDHMQQYRDMPGFQNSDGSWAWENDANQRAILQSIAQRGTDPIFEAFSNSPPYWMTNSGCASGSSNGSNNLKSDSYDDFAHYLTEVVKHYRDEFGITFRTLEPLNEPYANWWQANGSQEGCHFDRSSQEAIIQAVAEQLAAKGLTDTAVSAADENSMDDALAGIRGFSNATIAVLGQINVHSYAGSRRAELHDLAAELGIRLWQSESGPLGQDIGDDTQAALFMAGRIIQDLRELKPTAWVDWQSGDPSRSWASFTLNDNQQTYAPLKRFYMHAGFSRFIRPGATFVDVNHADMVAAVSEDGHTLALVVRNPDANATRGFTFDLTALPTLGASADVYRTSRTEDLAPITAQSTEGYRMVVQIPAYSITTFVLSMP